MASESVQPEAEPGSMGNVNAPRDGGPETNPLYKAPERQERAEQCPKPGCCAHWGISCGEGHMRLSNCPHWTASSAGAASPSAAKGLVPIGWQFRFVFPTHASNWHTVLRLPVTDMCSGDDYRYETRLVYAAAPTQGAEGAAPQAGCESPRIAALGQTINRLNKVLEARNLELRTLRGMVSGATGKQALQVAQEADALLLAAEQVVMADNDQALTAQMIRTLDLECKTARAALAQHQPQQGEQHE